MRLVRDSDGDPRGRGRGQDAAKYCGDPCKRAMRGHHPGGRIELTGTGSGSLERAVAKGAGDERLTVRVKDNKRIQSCRDVHPQGRFRGVIRCGQWLFMVRAGGTSMGLI